MQVKSLMLFFLLAGNVLLAQQTPQAGRLEFDSDTTAIGKHFHATVVLRYPLGAKLVPLDSAKVFDPFELVAVERMGETKTVGGEQVDSLWVTLRTFHLNRTQGTALEYAWFDGTDTLRRVTPSDSIRLNLRIDPYSEALQPKPDLDLIHIERPFNFQLLLAFLSFLGLLAVLGYVFLKKPVVLWFRRRQLTKKYEKLQLALSGLQAQRADALFFVNALNALWKDWLDERRNLHLRSLTPKELREQLNAHPFLAPEHIQLLEAWCRVEEQLNYARAAVAPAELDRLYGPLVQLLENDYQRRMDALR